MSTQKKACPRNASQVKSLLKKHSIEGDVRGRGQSWEVELPNESAKRAFNRHAGRCGGYKTGYGAWVLKPGYTGLGDYSDPSSKWHY